MRYTAYFTDLTHTGAGINSRGFPLGIGVVAAYAQQELADELKVRLFKFPENLSVALDEKIPTLLCMSNMCFNVNLSYEFARRFKQQNPELVVIFGGPNIPATPEGRQRFLRSHPAVDFYIKWDGEIAFVELFTRLVEYGFDVCRFKRDRVICDNCCYVADGDYVEGPDQKVVDFSVLPSPYMTGVLDQFFAYPLNPIIETTRGCPYSCTYCNDGNAFRNKVIKKSPEIIKGELEYIASRVGREAELWIADDNFGMFREDIETSSAVSSIVEKYGWPYSVSTSNGKSHPERILKSREIINQHRDGIIRFGASLQSADERVLREIKRKNLPVEKLLELARHKSNGRTRTGFFTELILPLPEDSLEAHYESLRYAIDVVGVDNIDVHQLNLFHGAEMADDESRSRYGFDCRFRVFIGCYGLYAIAGDSVPCAEIDETVVATKTLTFDDYIDCRIMDLLVKIYIDHDPFREVFGLIRGLGLSVFDLLRLLKEEHFRSFERLDELVADFVEGTKQPLFADRENILKAASDAGIVGRYISGQLGGNELLNCKARAFVECREELHMALEQATVSYIEGHELLTPVVEDYVCQAVTFSKLRKFDVDNLDAPAYADFTYDFIEAARSGYRMHPDSIKTDRTKYCFSYDPDTLGYIQTRMDCWGGGTLAEFGKLLQKTNMELMSRTVAVAHESQRLVLAQGRS